MVGYQIQILTHPSYGSSPLGEFTVGSFPFTWTLRRPDGSVYGRKAYNSSNEYFWTDALGSVRVRTSNSGSLLEAHDYYPFGLDMPGRSTTGSPVRQGFTGYWRDGESGLGLYYSGARMYSPGTGRFFGVDPLSEQFATWSPYVYTYNNPVNWRDPDGRAPCEAGTAPLDGVSFCFQSNEEIIVTPQKNFVNLWYDILNSPVGDAAISSEYGAQRTCANCSPNHKGTDYAVSVNTPVSVTANGTVVRSYYSRTFGNTVIVSHGPSRTGQGNVYTLYAHGSRLGAPQGGKVTHGDVILYSGNTGTNTTNPHLHYEVIISNHPPTSLLFFTAGIRLSPSQLKNLIW